MKHVPIAPFISEGLYSHKKKDTSFRLLLGAATLKKYQKLLVFNLNYFQVELGHTEW